MKTETAVKNASETTPKRLEVRQVRGGVSVRSDVRAGFVIKGNCNAGS